jgi:hypothetical protein
VPAREIPRGATRGAQTILIASRRTLRLKLTVPVVDASLISSVAGAARVVKKMNVRQSQYRYYYYYGSSLRAEGLGGKGCGRFVVT